ncbi:hypothetical protein BASA50_000522 [Batrachochytrium salamandrivorans]|uniref:EF-hand domain-containing protein n=1 Tax=Batrachochytrium salamandrivorans TaxID=1357716 RepID=A0ABQ8EU30_9FUNG|nr:hypothetical protein BASA60_009136 [Batrachochytrium salamandrivorans]KAH6578614.1 hypothetical protein BASA61_000078 [Batrachochytrium salamandrivorans]KAH6586568.1 hypothetical protein BASA50_000522 [Batrachochytrium salamandrivorans]
MLKQTSTLSSAPPSNTPQKSDATKDTQALGTPMSAALNLGKGFQSCEQLGDARLYLEKHHILDIVQQLTTELLVERPEHPQEFMVRRLEAMRVARTRNQNHILFSRENAAALYKIFDITGRGYITIEQYREAMMTMGATKYNFKPLGYGVNRISSDTFVDEALTALRKL